MKLPIVESYKNLNENFAEEGEEANIQDAMQMIMQYVKQPDITQDELELDDKLAMKIATATDDDSTDEFGWDGDIDMEVFAAALTRLFRLGKLVFDTNVTGQNLYIREN